MPSPTSIILTIAIDPSIRTLRHLPIALSFFGPFLVSPSVVSVATPFLLGIFLVSSLICAGAYRVLQIISWPLTTHSADCLLESDISLRNHLQWFLSARFLPSAIHFLRLSIRRNVSQAVTSQINESPIDSGCSGDPCRTSPPWPNPPRCQAWPDWCCECDEKGESRCLRLCAPPCTASHRPQRNWYIHRSDEW